jgi:hypothetical protein
MAMQTAGTVENRLSVGRFLVNDRPIRASL